MNKLSALCVLSLGVLAFYSADSDLSLAADANSLVAPGGGTTTYFPPSTAPAAATPDTTGAIPKADDTATPSSAETTPTPSAEPAPSTAAVTPPPAAETPPPADATPAAPATAAVTPPPPADTTPSASTPQTETAQPSPPPAAPVATPVVAPVSPVIEAVRKRLAEKSLVGRENLAEDVAAAADFYNTRNEPLWIKDGSYNEKGKSIISDLRKADDWGLESSDFKVAELGHGASAEAQGAAEAQLTLSALKYARFARGGRLDPVALSNILDMKPPVKNPKTVMKELAEASQPGAFLRGLNPHHPGFEKLRQALLKARGPQQEEDASDPALLVKLPRDKLLRPSQKDDQVSLLRQRLKVPAENPADEQVYDDKLVEAVRDAQRANGLRVDGVVGNRVRDALNSEGQPKRSDPGRNVDRLIANMERWRWLPENLGSFYVMNNIPEFVSEIWKGNQRELRQKMIVGQPSWPTPVLSSKMQFVIFHPSWGMPDGIKAKELLPRLRTASSSGFDFFDQLFGGGGASSGGARVLEAYKLQVYYKGHQIDPNSVNWNTADIRQYSFTQPPGADNPLGLVKFRFPNKHDVYMHDTPERGLFSQTNRALSHGCMRVGEPRKTAEIILQEDKGYSPEKVGELWDSGASVTLSKEVPVYLVYFTARVEDDGHLATFGDIYGNDERVMSALRGHPVRYTAPENIDPTEADQPGADNVSDAGSDNLQDAPPPARTTRSARRADSKRRGPNASTNTIQDALSNIFLN
ncbi:MAG TPA: L,D-transpeptidase family protein [Hyphomicrobium sp.]